MWKSNEKNMGYIFLVLTFTLFGPVSYTHLDVYKRQPWNWLNSPPTVNQVLGMQWLPRLLYPEQYDNDLYKTVAGYFKTCLLYTSRCV